MRRIWVMVITVAVIASGGLVLLSSLDRPPDVASSSTTTIPAEIPALVEVPCRAPTGGHDVDCYDTFLPQRRAPEPSGLVVLHVAVFRARGEPPPDPVVYLHGGPGGAILEEFASLYSRGFAHLYEGRDIVVFDQRGSGHARPRLACPERPEYASTLAVDDRRSLLAWEADVTGGCLADLAAGADLSAFGVFESADDLRDLIGLLGYEEVNLHAGSYGTRLAFSFLAHGDGAVRSVVAEGPYPLEVDGIAERGPAATAAIDTVLRACERDFRCNAAYPSIGERFYSLIDHLDAAPLVAEVDLPGHGTVAVVVNGSRVLEATYRGLYRGPLVGWLPQMIADLEAGNTGLFGVFLRTVEDISHVVDEGAFFAGVCSMATSDTPALAAESLAVVPAEAAGYFETTASAILDVCERMEIAPVAPVSYQGDVPILLLAGTYDPATPPAWAARGEAAMPGAYLVELTYGTHTNLIGVGTCGARLVADFVETLRRPGGPCLAVTSAIDFEVG